MLLWQLSRSHSRATNDLAYICTFLNFKILFTFLHSELSIAGKIISSLPHIIFLRNMKNCSIASLWQKTYTGVESEWHII